MPQKLNDNILERLALALKNHVPPEIAPLKVSPWVAMSLLQKSIRRGHVHLALQAATTLLKISPDRLWRRLGVIAFEDIGLGDLCIGKLTSVLWSKKTRTQLGGDWSVASYMISRMALAPKCRATDDLLMVALRHPKFLSARFEYAFLSSEELVGIVSGNFSLIERTIALLYLLGAEDGGLIKRPRHHEGARDALLRIGCSPEFGDLALDTFKKSRVPLAPLVGLLSQEFSGSSSPKIFADDRFPPEVVIKDVPGWAFDMFTREGKIIFGQFLSGASTSAKWLRTHVPQNVRMDVLGNLIFFLEGGCLRNRLQWDLGKNLYNMAATECLGTDASEIYPLLQEDFPALNSLRLKTLRGA